jgi:hypothetical protein
MWRSVVTVLSERTEPTDTPGPVSSAPSCRARLTGRHSPPPVFSDDVGRQEAHGVFVVAAWNPMQPNHHCVGGVRALVRNRRPHPTELGGRSGLKTNKDLAADSQIGLGASADGHSSSPRGNVKDCRGVLEHAVRCINRRPIGRAGTQERSPFPAEIQPVSSAKITYAQIIGRCRGSSEDISQIRPGSVAEITDVRTRANSDRWHDGARDCPIAPVVRSAAVAW